MNRNRLTIAAAFAAAFALCATVAFAADGFAADGDSHSGKIESVGEKSLVLTVDGKRHRFDVGEESTITLDGKEAKLNALKAGQTAVVTAKKNGEKMIATKIVARSAADERFAAEEPDDPANMTYSGKIESVGDKTLVLTVGTKRHQFDVGEECTLTLDGEEAKLRDLKTGQTAKITAKKDGEKMTATKVVATSRTE